MEGACIFDPARATFPTRVLPLERVIDPIHVTHAADRVAAFRAAMLRGERFPPVSVVRLGSRYFVADGHKRFSAYGALGAREILVEEWTVRRWLRDQAAQLVRKTRQQGRLVTRSLHDPAARADARRLAVDTARHWQRIARSLAEPRPPTVVRVLRPGGRSRAALRVVDHRGCPALRKDFSGEGTLFRWTAGALLAGREVRAYRRLTGVAGIPRLLARVRPDGLLLEHVDSAVAAEAATGPLSRAFFADLVALLAVVRARGVLHGDVRQNVLVAPDGRPLLVDFGASVVVPRLLVRLAAPLLRLGARYDARAVAKLMARTAPAALGEAEQRLLAEPLPFERILKRGERALRRLKRAIVRRQDIRRGR